MTASTVLSIWKLAAKLQYLSLTKLQHNIHDNTYDGVIFRKKLKFIVKAL